MARSAPRGQLDRDPNDVLVQHTFATMAEAEKFMTSAELRAAMESAGVEGMPRIEFFEEAK